MSAPLPQLNSMAYEASFGTLSSDVSPPAAGGPFRVAIFGDFSGRANRGERGDRDEIVGRKPREVAADKLDDLLAQYEPRLTLPFGRDGGTLELAFEELDQFHPERLLREADLVMDLVDLKGKVDRQAKKIVEWGGQYGAWGPLRPASRPAYGRAIAPVNAFSDFSQWQSVATAEGAGNGKLPEMIAQAVGGRAAGLDDPSEETLEEVVHQAVGDAIREIIHHPDYQALESAWRGVDFIARRTFKGEKIKIVLFDVTAEELAVDLASADDVSESAIYDLLVNRTWQAPNGDPWAMVVGLYEFNLTPPHAELLGRLAKLGATLQAPFLASLNTRVLGEEFALDGDEKTVWNELRTQPEAGWLGLATPGFLLRPPYGDGFKPLEDYSWEEFSAEEGAGGLLWGDPALAVATLLAQDYMRAGWTFKPGAKSEIPNTPLFVHRTDDEETTYTVAQTFTSKIGQQVTKLGGMPLLGVRGRDAIEVGKVISLAVEPPDLLGRWERPASSEVASAAAKGAKSPLKKPAASSYSDDDEMDDGLAALMDSGGSSDEDSSSDDDDSSSDESSDDFGSSDDDDTPSDSTSDDLDSLDDDDSSSDESSGDAASDDLSSLDDDLDADDEPKSEDAGADLDDLSASDDGDDLDGLATTEPSDDLDDLDADDEPKSDEASDDLDSLDDDSSSDETSSDEASDDLSTDDEESSDSASDDLSDSLDDDLSSSDDEASSDDDSSSDEASDDFGSSDDDDSSSDEDSSSNEDSSSDDDDPYAGLDDDSDEPTREPDPEPAPKPEPEPEPVTKSGRKPSKDPYGDRKKAAPPESAPASSGGFDLDAYMNQAE
ncbi:MAG TPA: type VI secretion system contractile sheath large subunit, partial [Pirellulales bacterium]